MRASAFSRTTVAAFTVVSFWSAQVLAAPAAGEAPTETPSDDEAARYGEAAVAAFESGNYDEAIENFQAAFELDGNPNNLFNIGRVYEESGELERAVEFYKQFVAQPKVSLENRKFALERIEVLEKTIAVAKGETATQPQPEPRPDPQPVVEAPANEPVDQGPSPDQERRRKQRIAGFSLLGVGGAALIGGAIVGGLTSSTRGQFEGSTDPGERQDLADRGRTLSVTADSLYAVGGTLALVGLIVALTALPKKGERRTAVAPVLDRHTSGVVVMTRF